MKALAYLLGARALDTARDADRGIRWPKPDEPLEPLEPIATSEASAAAWRRWREAGDIAATASNPPMRGGAQVLRPNRA